MIVELWICPNGHYYGSSSSHGIDLGAQNTYQSDLSHGRDFDPSHPPITGNRGICQQCKAAGRPGVQRTLVRVDVPLPVALAA